MVQNSTEKAFWKGLRCFAGSRKTIETTRKAKKRELVWVWMMMMMMMKKIQVIEKVMKKLGLQEKWEKKKKFWAW